MSSREKAGVPVARIERDGSACRFNCRIRTPTPPLDHCDRRENIWVVWQTLLRFLDFRQCTGEVALHLKAKIATRRRASGRFGPALQRGRARPWRPPAAPGADRHSDRYALGPGQINPRQREIGSNFTASSYGSNRTLQVLALLRHAENCDCASAQIGIVGVGIVRRLRLHSRFLLRSQRRTGRSMAAISVASSPCMASESASVRS